MPPIGVYIHIPFCRSKCPYCDFYSLPGRPVQAAEYIGRLKQEFKKFSTARANTLYLGGGTPTVLPATLLTSLLVSARETFGLCENDEITVEANPGMVDLELLIALRQAGANRLSFGVQSGVGEELHTLGRAHSCDDARRAVELARIAGFDNISLDLMIATPGQTPQSLCQTLSFLFSLAPRHISAYLLQVEEGTLYAKQPGRFAPPGEDEAAHLYELACNNLEKQGYLQYEISNFAQSGFESCHNLKYWHDEEYLGFGPSAHSFYAGQRFYYSRDLLSYITAPMPVADGPGGDFTEFCMLALRLREGVSYETLSKRFGGDYGLFERARPFIKSGLALSNNGRLHLTRQGFLLSNAVISALLCP